MSSIIFRRNFQRGLGTWPLRGAELARTVEAAAAAGYRAFDTAQMYGNEAELGAALAALGLPRDEICVTTKVHPENYGEDRFLASVERSLRDLRLDRVDLLLLHWPPADGRVAGPLRLLDRAQRAGLAAHVGVSNFTAAMMREARDILSVPPATNQVEFHPLLDQSRLLAAATETGIPLSAYSSVARGEVLRYPLLAEIGAGYGRSATQVVLRWILQKGVAVVTMSTKPENLRANYDVMDFTLSSVEMDRIGTLTRTGFRVVRSGVGGWADWD